jgi:transcriptional regulator GlxA family with amidase domain
VEFEDAPVLNRSGILKNVTANRILRSLLYKDPSDALYSFYGRAALLSVITDLLLATQETEKKHATVQQILAYIRHNPESDLSGEALSRVFSYHKNHINKLIKQETGRSLHAYAR